MSDFFILQHSFFYANQKSRWHCDKFKTIFPCILFPRQNFSDTVVMIKSIVIGVIYIAHMLVLSSFEYRVDLVL